MQPSSVLNECPLPRDRHRQEERIEPRVVEPFPSEATRRQYQPLLLMENRGQLIHCGSSLFRSHSAAKYDHVPCHAV